MGYATTLYSVDIGELKAAFGSKDAALLERVRQALSQKESGARRVDPKKGPRILVNWKSEIFLNGNLVSQDEFKRAMLNPDWEGTNIYSYVDDPPRGEKREGPFQQPGSFYTFMGTLGPFFAEHGKIYSKYFSGDQRCNKEQFEDIDSPEEDITEDQALEELIAGKITRRDQATTYGYALEQLCHALGTRLGPVGTDQMRFLQVKTGLTKARLPVKIPKPEDFPYISYLDAEQVRAEAEALQAMDLSYPRDTEVEAERRRFLEMLRNAVAQNRGMVGFYY